MTCIKKANKKCFSDKNVKNFFLHQSYIKTHGAVGQTVQPA